MGMIALQLMRTNKRFLIGRSIVGLICRALQTLACDEGGLSERSKKFDAGRPPALASLVRAAPPTPCCPTPACHLRCRASHGAGGGEVHCDAPSE